MASRAGKERTVTFKVDASLADAMERLPNRSAFIREAVLGALDNACPLCQGTGVLSPNQKKHWEALAPDHAVEPCRTCREPRLVCSRRSGKRSSRSRKRA